MREFYLIFAMACLWPTRTDAAECENGWSLFKDEYCVKAFSDFLTYDEARLFCASQGNSVSSSTLVMVKDSDMQEFLATYVSNVYDNLWLGGKYDNQSGQFKWADGDPLTFTNWAQCHARNNTDTDVCIELKPQNINKTVNFSGKWEDVPCQKRNLVMCQRAAPWSPEEAIRAIISLRKELQSTRETLSVTRQDLQETKISLEITNNKLIRTNEELRTVNSRVVPVGSIYVEYFNQPSPGALWPTMTWQDITSSYAGMFFRALGGKSDGWGVQQSECSPRLSEIEYTEDPYDPGNTRLGIPASGWSGYAHGGVWHGKPGSPGAWERIRYHMQSCENRPKNQAIRIWKRLL